jgi:hypothetical protein
MADEPVIVGQQNEPVVDELVRDAIAKELGLRNFGDIRKNQDKLKTIIDWAYVKGAKDRMDVIWAVKQLAGRVGSPKLGNNWPEHLAQYCYLEMERVRLDEQLKSMEAKIPEVKPEIKEETEENGRS